MLLALAPGSLDPEEADRLVLGDEGLEVRLRDEGGELGGGRGGADDADVAVGVDRPKGVGRELGEDGVRALGLFLAVGLGRVDGLAGVVDGEADGLREFEVPRGEGGLAHARGVQERPAGATEADSLPSSSRSVAMPRDAWMDWRRR